MSAAWNWSPFFDAVNGAIGQNSQRNQYKSLLNTMGAPSNPSATPMPQAGMDAEGTPLNSYGAGAQAHPQPSPMDGQMARIMPILQNLPPQIGLPLLLHLKERQMDNEPRQVAAAAFANAKTPQDKQAALMQLYAAGGDPVGLATSAKFGQPTYHEVGPGKDLVATDMEGNVTNTIHGPKAVPKIRKYQQGDQVVTEQYDPDTETWQQIGRGGKFKPVAPKLSTGAGPANNPALSIFGGGGS